MGFCLRVISNCPKEHVISNTSVPCDGAIKKRQTPHQVLKAIYREEDLITLLELKKK